MGTATADENGNWSFTPATALADGAHNITITAINTVGQTSDPTEAWRITVDTTAPDVSRLAVTGVGDDAGAVTGNVPNGGSTDDTRPLIQGTGTAGDTIIVSTTDFSGMVELGRTTVASDGNWSFTPTADLAAGSNAFSAVEVDPAGNASTRSANYTITVVTVKPPVAITEILDDVGDVTGALKPGSATDDGRPTINGVTEAGSTVSVFDGATLLGTAVANASGDWTFTPLAALAEGLHNLTARAVNPLGQSSDPTPGWGINVDVTPPVSASTTLDLMDASDWGVSNKDNITGDATPDLEGKVVASAETLDKLTVTLFVDVNGDNQAGPGDMFLARSIPVQADGSWSTSLASLKTGTYALRAVLVDEAGNQQVASAGSLIGPTGTPNSPLVIEAGGRMTYIGAKAGDQAGWEMADAGDFNGDGIGDFIVTAPYVDGNRADTGAAYILFGGAGGLPPIVHLGQLKASQGLRIKGHAFVKDNQTNDLMGLVLNKFGDFNRDGYADVFLASHYNDKAYVVFGAPNGSYADGVLDLSTIDGGDLGTSPIDNSHGFLISELPLSEDSGMGYSIGGSDINGDGYLDLMISNISGNKAAGSTGHALVIYGGANMNDSTTGWKNITLSQTNKDTIFRVQQDVKNTSITGGDASNVAGNRVKNANIGDNITSIGDVNGDGIADMLIIDSTSGGKTQINPLTSGGGTAYVVYGKTGGLPATMDLRNFKNGVDGVRLHTMLDDTLGTDNFASHVMTSALGDINGDGVDDFAMGSPVNLGRVWVIYGKAGGYAARDIYLDVGAPNDGKNYFARDPGHVKSFTSADGFVILNKASTVAAPARSTEQFGYAVKADGDINADGIPDFVIGAPNTKNPAGLQTGAIYVVYGTGQNISQPVLAINDIIADPAKGIVIYGDKSGEKLGSSVAVGDWNGDGLVDIAAGSSGSDVSGRDAAGQNYGGTDSGAAYIYYSRADFTQPYTNGNDILTGTLNGGADGFDRLFGGSGSDTFLSVSTGDYANGGAGNDTIHVSALDFKAVDGGMGTDVLVFDGKNQNIDLNLFKSKITGIEKIDLGINGSNLMTIGYNDVQRLGAMNLASNDGKAQFIVTGDNTDTLALRKPTGYNWTDAGHQTLDGVSYHVYTLGTSELFVDDRVNVTLL
ncbi:hypothetical protein DFLDMN_000655 [Cupriavidus sp. H19C3]